MVRLFAFILFNGLLLSQVKAADTTTTTMIAAFGDSLFSGYGLAPEDAYPAQLERRLTTEGYHVTVINDGIAGNTSAAGLSRVDQVIAQKPDLVLLEFGGNDLLRGIQPEELRKNLDAMLAKLRQANIRVIVFGMQAPLTMGAAYASAFNSLFAELAARYGAGLYPFVLDGVYGKPDLMQPDGAHPTKDGVATMVNNTYGMVTSALRK